MASEELKTVNELLDSVDLVPLLSDCHDIIYTYDTQGERTGITALLKDLNLAGIRFRDLHTTQSSLEDIFVDLVRQRR